MFQLFVFMGLLFIVVGVLIPSFHKLSANDDSQQEYVIRDLAVATFSVGAISVGSWLIEMIFANY